MHCRIVRSGAGSKPITLEEWTAAASKNPNVVITGELKQENPFTHEILKMKLPGSGYWCPASKDHTGWPRDGTVRFQFSAAGVVFIQYSNIQNTELQELANELCAVVESYAIARGS